jgi:hypothetical protein
MNVLLNSFPESLPGIIEQAAKSPFGILALMIIGLAILAFFFFRDADVKVRVVIYVMLFLGVVAFGVVVMQQARKNPPTLVASIWKVESGRQSTELATKEFSSRAGHVVPEQTLEQFAEWVSNQLKLTAGSPKVYIKVEKFDGPEKITERVHTHLEKNPLIQIVGPGSPGIDYIISGSVKRQP